MIIFLKYYLLDILISANRILQILCCVRQKDIKLVQMMERCELKQNLVKVGAGGGQRQSDY